MCPLYDSCVLESTRATGDPYSNTNSNNMLVVVPTLRQLACHAGAASSVILALRWLEPPTSSPEQAYVEFPGEFSITAGAFALGQVLNFGSLAYVADCYNELRQLHGAALASTEPPTSPTLLGLLGADLEVLAR